MSKKREWEKELEIKFFSNKNINEEKKLLSGDVIVHYRGLSKRKLKSFISQLLKAKEKEVREKTLKEFEGITLELLEIVRSELK